MKATGHRWTGLLAVLAVAALGVTPGLAMSMAPQSVADLTRAAHDIVVGTVSRVTEGRQGSLPYIEVEVSVSETIQGAPARTLTFRQPGLQARQEAAGGRRFVGLIPGMPVFAAGENVILFLGPTSSIGFRTTVGLEQGKFAVAAGNAANATGNAGLFRGVTTGSVTPSEKQAAMLATRQGGVQARTFIDFVRQGVQQHWWK